MSKSPVLSRGLPGEFRSVTVRSTRTLPESKYGDVERHASKGSRLKN